MHYWIIFLRSSFFSRAIIIFMSNNFQSLLIIIAEILIRRICIYNSVISIERKIDLALRYNSLFLCRSNPSLYKYVAGRKLTVTGSTSTYIYVYIQIRMKMARFSVRSYLTRYTYGWTSICDSPLIQAREFDIHYCAPADSRWHTRRLQQLACK